MSRKPTIRQTETVARSRLFRIEALELEFANGTVTHYERLAGSGRGAVLIVPVTAADEVLLVREYAAGVHRYELGLPKGRIEGEEPLLEAGNREIMEEIGYAANRLEELTSLTLAPGYLGHTTHVVVARDLYPRREPGDEPEELEVVPWPLADIGELAARPDVTEARTIAALYLARDHLAAEAG